MIVGVYNRRNHPPCIREWLMNPPDGVEYVRLPYITPQPILPVHNIAELALFVGNLRTRFLMLSGIDVLHYTNKFILNKKKWVADFEQYYVTHPRVERVFSSRYCRKLMPWSEYVKERMLRKIRDKSVHDKIEVLYPCIRDVDKKKSGRDKLSILFIGNRFFDKGGLHLLNAFNQIKDRYPITLTLVSNFQKSASPLDTPANRQLVFNESKTDRISLYSNIPNEELYSNYYPSADVFVFTPWKENFGFVVLEAMAFGLPTISYETCAIPEMLEDEVTGLMVEKTERMGSAYDEYMTNNIKDRLIELIESESKREKLGRKAHDVARTKFSIKKHSEKLKRIYGEAIG